jgi:hypothetical protein
MVDRMVFQGVDRIEGGGWIKRGGDCIIKKRKIIWPAATDTSKLTQMTLHRISLSYLPTQLSVLPSTDFVFFAIPSIGISVNSSVANNRIDPDAMGGSVKLH